MLLKNSPGQQTPPLNQTPTPGCAPHPDSPLPSFRATSPGTSPIPFPFPPPPTPPPLTINHFPFPNLIPLHHPLTPHHHSLNPRPPIQNKPYPLILLSYLIHFPYQLTIRPPQIPDHVP